MTSRIRTLTATLRTNAPDILFGLLVVLLFHLTADYIVSRSAEDGESTWLVGVVATLQGFAKFAAANLCMWLLGIAVAWPTLNGWSNSAFSHAWRQLPLERQLYVFVAVACAEGIMAALCFAA